MTCCAKDTMSPAPPSPTPTLYFAFVCVQKRLNIHRALNGQRKKVVELISVIHHNRRR